MSEQILIIEDETAIQSILSELLTDAGYEIEVAGDGLEGITKFREKTFSLVLLDIMLPKIDGYAVCEMIRKESNIPIIMLTALDEEEAQIKAFELEVDDYITKPFSVKLVLMRVEAVLRRVQEKETPGQTNKEYQLAKLFLQNQDRIFTRDNLLNQVWGYDIACEEKNVNIHIMNLRRKLGTDIIETIRGVGYRLGKKD